jgi:beta-lactamase regulating signal transducer with metallopeptidase domain
MTWLTDTLISTGALIALVLLLRRPVTRLFGPGLAYALWALPLLRLVLPPLVLPAQPAPVLTEPVPVGPDMVLEPGNMAAAAPAWSPFAWVQAVWLGGAALYLGWRCWQYLAMRRHLLAGAREVGREGRVRLVEGPRIVSPVAFGVFDKVVALPVGFLDISDPLARDLAIAHELEHHAGRDLAANIAMQPLLALHWFNPLAWLGWRALRRDQEAACDARVLAGKSAQVRASYAQLIAAFAQGRQPSLAAPLACAVVGEKSIVHRLRSLTMTQPSPRRRLAGRALIAAAVLALPLSATITYAAPDAVDPPAPPEAPAAPAAPEAPRQVRSIVIVDQQDGADPADAKLKTRVITRDGQTIVFKTNKDLSDAEIERQIAEAERGQAEADRGLAEADRGRAEAERQVLIIDRQGNDKDAKDRPVERSKQVVILRGPDGDTEVSNLGDHAIAMSCAGKGNAVAIAEEERKEGRQEKVQLRWCSKGEVAAEANKQALAAMKRAREDMARNRELSEAMREKVLKQLDEKIAELSRKEG